MFVSEELNECELVTDICNPRICINTDGSYMCTCDSGYTWTGVACEGTTTSPKCMTTM